jgi:hypothetical protein
MDEGSSRPAARLFGAAAGTPPGIITGTPPAATSAGAGHGEV